MALKITIHQTAYKRKHFFLPHFFSFKVIKWLHPPPLSPCLKWTMWKADPQREPRLYTHIIAAVFEVGAGRGKAALRGQYAGILTKPHWQGFSPVCCLSTGQLHRTAENHHLLHQILQQARSIKVSWWPGFRLHLLITQRLHCASQDAPASPGECCMI